MCVCSHRRLTSGGEYREPILSHNLWPTGAISAAAVLVRRLGGAARPIAFVLLVEVAE